MDIYVRRRAVNRDQSDDAVHQEFVGNRSLQAVSRTCMSKPTGIAGGVTGHVSRSSLHAVPAIQMDGRGCFAESRRP